MSDGHRDKKYSPGWVHNQKYVRKYMDFDHTVFRSTFLGMHLTAKFPDAKIHIVESEKTALICAIHFGDFEHHLFIACGGLKNLRTDMMQSLFDADRDIFLWPDKDGIEDWRKFQEKFPNKRITLYTDFLEQNWQEQDGNKADVADIIIRSM